MSKVATNESKAIKRTLRKRISKVILVNILISLFLFILIFITMSSSIFSFFVSNTCETVSASIANEIKSTYFLKQMKVSKVEDINFEAAEGKAWIENIDERLKRDISNNSNNINFLNELKPKQMLLEAKKSVAAYAAYVVINFKDKVIYENRDELEQINNDKLLEFKKQHFDELNFQDKVNMKLDDIAIRYSTSSTEILDSSGKKIGTITVKMPKKVLGDMAIAILGAIFISGLIAIIISKIICHVFIYPIIMPLKMLQKR